MVNKNIGLIGVKKLYRWCVLVLSFVVMAQKYSLAEVGGINVPGKASQKSDATITRCSGPWLASSETEQLWNDSNTVRSARSTAMVYRLQATVNPPVEPATVMLTAGATATDGGVKYVDFYLDNRLVGRAFRQPDLMYGLTINNVPAGTYGNIYAIATSICGSGAASSSISFGVAEKPGSVYQSAPPAGAKFPPQFPPPVVPPAEVCDYLHTGHNCF